MRRVAYILGVLALLAGIAGCTPGLAETASPAAVATEATRSPGEAVTQQAAPAVAEESTAAPAATEQSTSPAATTQPPAGPQAASTQPVTAATVAPVDASSAQEQAIVRALVPPEIAALKGTDDVCQWQPTQVELSGLSVVAVACDSAGHVTNLALVNKGYTAVPPTILQLSHLQVLDLSHNQLAAVPPEIAGLSGLTTLDLSFNPLGSLPVEIAQLSHLQHLLLTPDPITTLPPEICSKLSTMIQPPSLCPGFPGPSSIVVTPTGSDPFPAGSSSTYTLELQPHADAVAWTVGDVPPGVQTRFLGSPAPYGNELVITADPSTAPGEYGLTLIASQPDTNQVIASLPIAFGVSGCVPVQTGQLSGSIKANPSRVITAGKPDWATGLLVPIQVCQSTHLKVTVTQVLAENGTPLAGPMPFYLYRSIVYPAPSGINAAAGCYWCINVELPRIDNADWALETDVVPGLYILVFQNDRYPGNPDPGSRPDQVTYTLHIGP